MSFGALQKYLLAVALALLALLVEVGLEQVRHQRPLNSGSRFSRKAFVPSTRSSVAIASS